MERNASTMAVGGRNKRGEGVLIGDTGEYAVMSESLKQSVVAALAPRKTPWFDILATKGERTVRLGRRGCGQLAMKLENILDKNRSPPRTRLITQF